ncbi:hypothetical protein LCI18_003018 [Fusarium solani-melongenae]|uniref:Uncharacterized protein n=1 Tax=Fusarium solani subsp. cucurbitae TaxID=2747967 RepID=A0ACD3YTB0_FUSSC|nr:hypothetical protein LCI18_003018 [Fusarium solani-melongenae]
MVPVHIHIALLFFGWWLTQRITAEEPPSAFNRGVALYIELYAAAVVLVLLLNPRLAARTIRERIAGYLKFTEGIQQLWTLYSHQAAYFSFTDRFPEQIASLVNFYASSPRSSTTTTTGNKSPYTYSSLAGKNHIRLLLLCPASTPEAPLRGYLLPTHVDGKNLSYAALFYSKPLSLALNLVNALRAIRDEVSHIPIWVDQICINQADIDERYVRIWIGDDTQDGSVAKAFNLVQHLGSFDSRLYKEFTPSNGVGDCDVDVQTCRKYGIPLLHEAMSEYATLVSFICRPWFSRSWTVQEVALNANIKVSCGSSVIAFIPLWTAISFCSQQFSSSVGSVPRNIREAYESLSLAFAGSTAWGRRNLLAVLRDHRYYLSTEARDKVFAFLSIAADAHDLGIVADYSLCARSVFTKTAAKMIRHCPNLDILSYATPWPRLENSEGGGIALGKCKDATNRCQDVSHPLTLPSWAPDWSTVVDCGSFRPIGPAKRLINFSATGNSRHKPQFRKNDTQLGLQGIILDQVAQRVFLG